MTTLLKAMKALFHANIRSRHLQALWHYSTPAKLSNLLLSEAEKRLGILRTRARPYTASIEVTNTCNLRCPFCPTGKHLYGRKPAMVDLSHVERLLDELGRYLYIMYLFNKGEPLLHPQIGRIVRMVHDRGIHTLISTHLNITNKKQLERVCDAHLDSMILSIDGVSQETYAKYRIGGNLELVLDSIRHIVDYKRRSNLRLPVIEWQFLVFDHNRHELEAARDLAKKLGVDAFLAKPGFVPDDVNQNPLDFARTRCDDLYQTLNMQVDGGITPCCSLLDKEDDFALISNLKIKELRRSECYTMARQLFRPRLLNKLPEDLAHPCLSCPLTQLQPHLANYLKHNKHTKLEAGAISMQGGTISVRSAVMKPDAKAPQ